LGIIYDKIKKVVQLIIYEVVLFSSVGETLFDELGWKRGLRKLGGFSK